MEYKYESVCVFNPNITLRAYMNFEDKIKNIIGRYEITEIENLGLKTLAYELNHYNKGIYIVIHYKGNNDIVTELEKYFRINNNILKFFTVKMED